MLIRKVVAFIAAFSAMASIGQCGGNEKTARAKKIVLQNEYVTYIIGADGKNLSFLDKRSGKEYCAQKGQRAFVTLKKGDTWYEPTTCTFSGGKITVQFEKADITAVLKAACKKHYFVFEVESVSGPEVDEIVLSNLAVTSCKYVSEMSGVATDDDFAACVRALNLQVNGNVGGRPAVLSSSCYRKYGLVGAKVALVGCPTAEIRTVLKEVIRNEGLPYSPLGGPWALDAEENRGSYMFASPTEGNVDAWIALAKKAGLTHLLCGGWISSAGHYEPPKRYPRGLDSVKAIVDKIHAAGLKAGLHTATGLIAPRDSWVTPVPDKRLATDATFTLAASVDERETKVLTVEQPEEFDTVWHHSGHGNVIRIGDELIQYSGLSRNAPYGFTDCTRGAFGTRAAPHKKETPVRHMFVRYTKFMPDENSSLVDDIAEAIAGVYNTCGFDMIYMDGVDPGATPGGWHGAAKIQTAIFKRLKGRVLVEASCWNYHSWPFHSRIGAWDSGFWGVKRFVDIHCRPSEPDIDGRTTERHRQSTLLPTQLGWWFIYGPNRNHRNNRAQLPDEIEYLCCKALAHDAALSFGGLRPGGVPPNARQDEFLKIVGRYERLRLADYFPESVKEKLRKEKQDFRLVQALDGAWQFVPTDYVVHKVTGLTDGTARWTVKNRFAAQPVKLRLAALYSVEPYDGAESLTLTDFGKEDEFTAAAAAPGITHALSSSKRQVKVGALSGRYSAKNTGTSRRGAWAKVSRVFAPPVDIDKYDALGVWIHGDGKGELLNFQLTNPHHYYPVLDEHYVKVDFQGWRYFELLLRERDAEQYSDYIWPDLGNYGNYINYAVYRQRLQRKHINALNTCISTICPRRTASPVTSARSKRYEQRR